MSEIKLGKLVIEGKTKAVYDVEGRPGIVLLQSKDRITAGDGAKAHAMQGKAAIATSTTCSIFRLLKEAGVKTAFIEKHSDTAFLAQKCDMIPIEWVSRRVATGSFLKRHPGVKEGHRFCPPKQETFFKDDANHDPQWSDEQLEASALEAGGVTLGCLEIDVIRRTSRAVFEILERAWSSVGCSLIDMKIEFGVTESGDIVLADVIDNDSWRLWPSGDKRLMKDKQVYRDMKEVTDEAMLDLKKNFAWVADKAKELVPQPKARVAVLMGSDKDMAHAQKIQTALTTFGVPCDLRVTSAHKGPDVTLRILAEYEGAGIPTVFIAVAGRSNGLGPVLSGNATWPVINCPPSRDSQDVWSSLSMPSGLGCSTVLSPEGAALNAAQMVALSNHVVWSRLRVRQLDTWVSLLHADRKCQGEKADSKQMPDIVITDVV